MMKSPEGVAPEPAKLEAVPVQLPSPEIEKEGEPSNEKLVEVAASVEQTIQKQTSEILQTAEQKVVWSTQSLGVSPEELIALRQEQGFDAQLQAIAAESAQLVTEATNETKAIMAEGEAVPPMENKNVEVPQQPSLKDTVRLRQERVSMLAATVNQLRQQDPQAFIESFNRSMTSDALQGLEFSVIKSEGNDLLILNESGQLSRLECTADNAVDVLRAVKEHEDKARGNSHELRSEIIKRSRGSIKTNEAYTYGRVESLKGAALKAFLDESSNWTEERQLLHQEIIDSEMLKAKELSDRLGDEQPAMYALRGNTAAGKTTRVKNDPTFSRAIDANGDPSGAINPDIYKEQLKSSEKIFGKQKITHFQAHNEGSMLTRKIKTKIAESDSSMIIDQRLNEAKDITDLIQESERTGKKMKILDVDSPMELSLVRVLARKPGGADPLAPFVAVAEGYEGVRKNRAELVATAAENQTVETYALYASDERGATVKVAEKSNGTFKVLEGQEENFSRILDGNTESTVEQLRTQVIDDAYIARAKDELKLPAFQIQALEKYRGKTFEDALGEHSKQIDMEAPSFETYTAAALVNLENTSRTAKGTVDTSASADKAQKMQAGLTGESAAELAKGNFQDALKSAYDNKDTQFKNPQEVRQFIESIASTINRGITKEGVLIRQGEDSPKYPYTRVADLEKQMTGFYEELQKRLDDPKEDPKTLAAWVEYKIDLSDHFFADGCGKTAKLVSSWVMMRAAKQLPDYTMGGKIPAENARAEYYAHAPKTIPGTNPQLEAEELQRWTAYYKKL